MNLYTETDADAANFIPWSELSADRQRVLMNRTEALLQRERDEVKFLRALLLSNGGRTADEINSIQRGW